MRPFLAMVVQFPSSLACSARSRPVEAEGRDQACASAGSANNAESVILRSLFRISVDWDSVTDAPVCTVCIVIRPACCHMFASHQSAVTYTSLALAIGVDSGRKKKNTVSAFDHLARIRASSRRLRKRKGVLSQGIYLPDRWLWRQFREAKVWSLDAHGVGAGEQMSGSVQSTSAHCRQK